MNANETYAGKHVLHVTGGEHDGRQIEVTPAGLTVGRSPVCDIVLDNRSVSRQHVRFYILDGFCYAEDLGSHNGLLVCGRRTRKQCLRSGDVVDLGHCRFTLRTEGSPLERQTAPEIVAQVEELKRFAPGKQAAASAVPRSVHPLAIASGAFGVVSLLHWAFGIV